MMKVMEMDGDVLGLENRLGMGESRSAAEPSFSAVRGAGAGLGRQGGGQ